MTEARPEDGAVPNLQLEFQSGIDPEQRRSVELSIASLVARSSEAMAQRLADSAKQRELTAAINRPLLELLRADPAAAQALERARNPQRGIDDLENLRPLDARTAMGQDLITFDFRGALEVFVIPFHFNWRWFVAGGGAPRTSFAELPTGEIGLDARVGAPPDFSDVPFVNAHTGFGISLTTGHDVQATARSLRRVGYRYSVGAGFLGDATVEGGEEYTVFEAGKLITSAGATVFRKRVSGSLGSPSESAAGDSGGVGNGEFLEVKWTMRAGHSYQFNVGQWVFCDRHPGIGGAGGISQMFGTVVLMTLFR